MNHDFEYTSIILCKLGSDISPRKGTFENSNYTNSFKDNVKRLKPNVP